MITFTVEAMKQIVTERLENCVLTIAMFEQGYCNSLLGAAYDFGIAGEWLDNLYSIGIDFPGEDGHIDSMLRTAGKAGLCYSLSYYKQEV